MIVFAQAPEHDVQNHLAKKASYMPDVKFRAGQYLVPGSMNTVGGVIELKFRYNKTLLEEIKSFDGARWNPDKKLWTIKDSERNQFQLKYLLGNDPYAWYDQPLKQITTDRPLRTHQVPMVQHQITYHQVITAAEMGTGKSLAAIVAAEYAALEYAALHPGEKPRMLWVAPKSALRSVDLEMDKWQCRVKIELHTYDSLKRLLANWKDGDEAPFLICFDESSRVKNHTAQRSQASYELAKGVRQDHGMRGYVILMSGTPAPKSPADWFWQCEIAQPGFLKEGNYNKFKQRLGLIVQKESIQGGSYPQLVTWLDDERKCLVCGQLQDHINHDAMAAMVMGNGDSHAFVASKNEVSILYERMKGLVHVVFKKDCLDLPDKVYEIIRCKPTPSVLRAASIITAKAPTVVSAMVLLRELSDGFQYEVEETGTITCSVCKGTRTIKAQIGHAETQVEITAENIDDYRDAGVEIGDFYTLPTSTIGYDENDDAIQSEEISCPHCGGSGEIVTTKRIAVQIPCPKEDVVKDLLDQYDDVGRTVWFGGFTGSIDRISAVVRSVGWDYIRVDGRGWSSSIEGLTDPKAMLLLFQDANNENHPRIAFIGQPGAAGMGLTLTASPMICYYSNDFNAESRIQSEDRIHRIGMDVNRGATIYDIIHLPTDEKVLENLKKKRDLQAMSLGDMRKAFAEVRQEDKRLI